MNFWDTSNLTGKLKNCESDKCSPETVTLPQKNIHNYKTFFHVCVITEAISHWFLSSYKFY